MDWALLSGLSEPARQEVLAAAHRRGYARNEVLFHQGDPGDSLHLIAGGHVAVRVVTPMGDIATLRVIGAGDHVGELTVLSPAPRSATVVALDDVETLTLHRVAFEELRRLLDLEAMYATGDGPTTIHLTQNDLAGLAGTSRKTVNEVLGDTQDRGVLRLARGPIEILDLAGLRALART